MKLATIRYQDNVFAGILKDGNFYSFQEVDSSLPNDMALFIEGYDTYKGVVEQKLAQATATCAASDAVFLSPIPRPRTFRDFMCFEEHVINSGKAAGFSKDVLDGMMAVWKKMPAFYFSNTNVFYGAGEPIKMHPVSQRFDIELEIGVIVGKEGINLSAEEAMDRSSDTKTASGVSLKHLSFAYGHRFAKRHPGFFSVIRGTDPSIV